MLAFWAALHARARLLLRAALRVHSVGRFVRALTFRFARPVVRLDEGRSHHFRLSRLSRASLRRRFKSFRSLLVGHLPRRLLGFGKEVLRFMCLEKKLSPLLAHSPRHRAPSSFRSVHRPPSGVRARSSYGQSLAAAFHLRAAPYCGRLSLLGFLGCFRTSSITRKTSRSPRGSRDVLRVLASAFTYDASRSPFGSHVGSHVFTFAELSLLEHACLLGRPRTFALRAITQTRSPFGGSLARGHDAPFEARA